MKYLENIEILKNYLNKIGNKKAANLINNILKDASDTPVNAPSSEQDTRTEPMGTFSITCRTLTSSGSGVSRIAKVKIGPISGESGNTAPFRGELPVGKYPVVITAQNGVIHTTELTIEKNKRTVYCYDFDLESPCE